MDINAVKDKIGTQINRLPFRGMAEKKISPQAQAKFPFLGKLIPNANFIAVGLALVLVVTVIACSGKKDGGGGSGGGRASPASDFSYDMTEDGSGIQITKYTGNGGKVIVPSTIENLPVLEIRGGAFSAGEYQDRPAYMITSVVIPSSVRSIGIDGLYTFRNCENLTSVTIQGTGVIVGQWTFDGCTELSELNISNDEKALIPDPNFSYNSSFSHCKKLPLAMRQRLKDMGFTNL